MRDDRGTKLGFVTPSGDWFFVDYIITETFRGDLTIDLDVNSFAVSPDLGLHKREYLKRPMCKTYGNIKRKVAYLIKNDPPAPMCDYMTARVKKMQDRGWKVIRGSTLAENCQCKK